MAKTLAVRVDDQLVETLDEVASAISTRIAGAKLNRSEIARIALAKGAALILDELESNVRKTKR